MNHKEAQEEELTVLESIYDKNILFIDRNTEFASGRFFAHPVVPDSYNVKFKELTENGCEEVTSFSINYLPPITLHFQLHPHYPSRKNPAFLLLCDWLLLTQLEKICEHLDRLWQDGGNEVILYAWMQFLEHGVLSFLGIQDSLNISDLKDNQQFFANASIHHYPQSEGHSTQKINKCSSQYNEYKNTDRWTMHDQQAHSSSYSKYLNHVYHMQNKNSESCDSSNNMSHKINHFSPCVSRGNRRYDQRALCTRYPRSAFLIRRLKGHNERRLKESYENEWFTCDVCMENKQGKCFMKFADCQHMYCKDCMKSYFEVQIKDGSVRSITCPKEKCSSQPLPSQILELVGPDLYNHYDKLLLTATLETMTDVMYCPRVFCQCAVMLEPDRSMAICPSCQYVFCVYCKMVYHGVASCKFSKEERKQIREEYLTSSKEERELLEKRYGRRSLQMLVDETLSEEWLAVHSKKCPECKSSIEKFEGCNKITCWRCGSYFCWLCMMKLKTSNPYNHYNDPKSPCYNQLLVGIQLEDDEDWEVGAFL